ncbi:hypothetical protein M9434_006155 [Picochlorum sp. BPE23]|nr:hypothetical protein M9434_006155 [Picochlorum sp. BPE23]
MDRGQQRLLNQKVAEINAKFPGIRTMTPAEVKQLERQGQRIVFVDCRTAPEMDVSRIHPDAISEDECIRRIDSIKNSEPPALVVGYCTIGYRSAKFVQKMKRSAGLGDADIVNLSGSILQWMQDSYDLWDATGSRTDRVHVWGKEYCQYVPEQGPNANYKSEYFKNPILASVFPQYMDFIKNIFGFGSDKNASSSSASFVSNKTEEQRNEQRVEPRRVYAQPLLQDCPQAGNAHKDQGLEWCSKSLKRDEDDDYAHGFLDENACFVESQRLKKSSTTAHE